MIDSFSQASEDRDNGSNTESGWVARLASALLGRATAIVHQLGGLNHISIALHGFQTLCLIPNGYPWVRGLTPQGHSISSPM